MLVFIIALVLLVVGIVVILARGETMIGIVIILVAIAIFLIGGGVGHLHNFVVALPLTKLYGRRRGGDGGIEATRPSPPSVVV